MPIVRLPFLEDSSPPPFYQPSLSDEERLCLDRWFIGERSQRHYLKAFSKMDKAKRLQPNWNWAAFFMTFAWLLYRKRFLDCFVYCVAGLSFVKLTVVISLAILEFFVVRHLTMEVAFWVRVLVGGGIWLFWAGQVARWADAYYYRMARREIADALALHPYDKDAQKAYLTRHGGTSVVGLGGAFLLYVAILSVIAFHFVPLWAKQKEEAIIYQSYQVLSHARERVSYVYVNERRCPVHMPMGGTKQVSLQVVSDVAGVATDCAIVLTIRRAGYPVRYLNGQTMVMYRADGQTWRCQSSFSQRKNPKGCL